MTPVQWKQCPAAHHPAPVSAPTSLLHRKAPCGNHTNPNGFTLGVLDLQRTCALRASDTISRMDSASTGGKLSYHTSTVESLRVLVRLLDILLLPAKSEVGWCTSGARTPTNYTIVAIV